MTKGLQSRLEGLAIDASNINNFNYASEYGYNVKTINSLIENIIGDFPSVYSKFTETMLLSQPKPDFSRTDINKLSEWESKIAEIFGKLRDDKSYKSLLKAYNTDDQESIADFLDLVFVDLSRSRIISPNSEKLELFHGITVPEGMKPKDYLDLCIKIKESGLKPSAYGYHMGMDSNIRPIFATPEIYETHGLAFFSFNPIPYTVVLDNAGDEARIYAPVLKTDLDLWLRDADTLMSYSGSETGIYDKKESEKYVKDLEEIMKERKIKFKKLGLPES